MEENNKITVIPDETTQAENISDSLTEQKHSHHSHHHHSHHSHRRKHKRRTSNSAGKKLKNFFKRYKSIIINILSCTVSVVLLILLAAKKDTPTNNDVKLPEVQTITESTVKIETSVYPEKVRLISDAIAHYLDPSNNSTALESYRAYYGYTGGLDAGRPVTFVYRASGLPAGTSVEGASLDVSESSTYEDARTYDLGTDTNELEIFNLKTGTKYYYRLNIHLSNGCDVGATGSFETEATPRVLNIDGLVNVRDIGGWETTDGKTIRQGLIYRGCELDGAVEPSYCLTDTGFLQMTNDLGIRFDLDLRPSTDNKDGKDALGHGAIHKYYNSPMYSDILRDDGPEVIRNIFSELAKAENYPIYIHCTYGRDRTGTVCYLLEAMLGVSDADLYRDYELSAFTDSYVNYAEFDTFVERIRSLEGDNTKERVENWLLSIGVSAKELESIREILLEE
ncbi:MAG: tyrosine-protein phosphatase [Clostridia bacterium]|nr:tyrosine-protein phosphatase [Clostridia bacterium]